MFSWGGGWNAAKDSGRLPTAPRAGGKSVGMSVAGVLCLGIACRAARVFGKRRLEYLAGKGRIRFSPQILTLTNRRTEKERQAAQVANTKQEIPIIQRPILATLTWKRKWEFIREYLSSSGTLGPEAVSADTHAHETQDREEWHVHLVWMWDPDADTEEMREVVRRRHGIVSWPELERQCREVGLGAAEIEEVKKAAFHKCGRWCQRKQKRGRKRWFKNAASAGNCTEGHPRPAHDDAGPYGRFGEWEGPRPEGSELMEPFSLEIYLLTRFLNVNVRAVAEDTDAVGYLFSYITKNTGARSESYSNRLWAVFHCAPPAG